VILFLYSYSFDRQD